MCALVNCELLLGFARLPVKLFAWGLKLCLCDSSSESVGPEDRASFVFCTLKSRPFSVASPGLELQLLLTLFGALLGSP